MPPKRKSTKKQVQAEEDVDYSKLKVTELRDLCVKRGLDSKGNKGQLVKTLQDEADCGSGGKKAKAEPEEKEEKDEKPTMKDKLHALAVAEKANKTAKACKIDENCYLFNHFGARVVDDYDCMLNQTNIGQNNNKFYVIQLIQWNTDYYVWNRWGRVGETGQDALKGPFPKLEAAVKEFEKKFKDKTRNNWPDRDNFVPSPGKYTLLEIESTDEVDFSDMNHKLAKIENPNAKVKPCSLIKETKSLIDLIFNEDMFKEAMQDMNIDIKKMPLGKLSKMQIAKGFEVLEEMQQILEQGSQAGLEKLTSTFYTLIPHNFGRQRPPVIRDQETLRKKMDMLLVLGDIEIAQALKTESESQDSQGKDDCIEHPADINYGLLSSDLELVPASSKEYKILEGNFKATSKNSWQKMQLLDIWKVNRHNEGQRFASHDDIENRKLLWHGTNVAVVVAILKSGLRIMPHSGGRVGRGIYFASECSKSSGYVSPSRNGTGIMFLNEVALGKEHSITRDNSSLKSAPKGFDSVVARGRAEPDPSKDTFLSIDDKKVIVPQGAPKNQPQYKGSSFDQSEYLVYKESQARIRYLLTFKFS